MYAVIQSLLRRVKKNQTLISSSDFKYEKSTATISFKEKELHLTHAEYEVLSCLLSHKNSIVSREQIVASSKSLGDSNSKSLDVIISRLRTKIEDDAKNPKYIHSIRGLGYKVAQ